MTRDAYISDCGKYRYWLTRVWDSSLPMLGICGVNPSVADHKIDDPTIRKGIGFGTRLGYGGLLQVNVAAYKSTDPRQLPKTWDAIGSKNSIAHIKTYLGDFGATKLIAAWGRNGRYFIGRCDALEAAIPNLYAWGLNSDGSPVHPLMLPYSTELKLLRDLRGASRSGAQRGGT